MAISGFVKYAQEQNRLSSDDLDDPRIPVGGTPSWWTGNIRAHILVKPLIKVHLAIENIFDLNYREHGSGINGPGRDFRLTIRYGIP